MPYINPHVSSGTRKVLFAISALRNRKIPATIVKDVVYWLKSSEGNGTRVYMHIRCEKSMMKSTLCLPMIWCRQAPDHL